MFSSGRAKKNPRQVVTEQDKAILAAKMARDRLKQVCKRCELSIEKDRERARELLKTGNKRQALLLLKRKRYEESTVAQVEGHIDRIEQMIRSLEIAQLNVEVTERLRQGNEALKSINESISIDEVERILDETREAEAFQEELAFLLRGKLSEADEQAAEDEYETMLAQSLPEPVAEQPAAAGERVEEKERRKEREPKRREAVALQAS